MARLRYFGIAAALLLSGCGLGGGDPRSQAEDAIARNDLRGARVYLISALETAPDDHQLRLQLARVLVDMGDGDGARSTIAKLPDAIRTGPEASGLLAHALLLIGQVEAALETASLASETSPRAAWVETGALLATEKVDEAYAAADAAVERFPKDARLLSLRGEMALRRGQISSARGLARRALEAEGDSLQGLLLSGRLDLLDENREAARDHFDKAAESHPTVVGPLLYLAATEADLGERDAAVKTLGRVEALAPDHPVATFLKAKIAFHDSDLETAHRLMQSVESDLRDMPQAALLLGEIAYLRGSQNTAISYLQRFLQDNPGHLHGSLVLAQAFIAAGDESAAWDTVKGPAQRAAASPQLVALAARLAANRGEAEKFAARLPGREQASDAHVQLVKADKALASGDWKAAAGIYASLREQGFGNNALVLNNAAVAELNSGRDAEALRLARAAHALTPQDPQVQDTLGWVLLEAGGDKAEALRLTSSAMKALPTDFSVRWHHAQALAANGRKAEARQLVAALMPFGNAEQRARLDALLERL